MSSFEDEPTMKLNLAGEEFEATPENAHLYHFLGAYACYSHVFLKRGVTPEGKLTGSYIFSHSSVFEDMQAFMLANGYPAHINQREVPQCDLDAFEDLIKVQTTDVGDTVPEGWE